MKIRQSIPVCFLALFLFSCGEIKKVSKGNKVYRYFNNQGQTGKKDQVKEYLVTKKIKVEIKDKTDYYTIKEIPESNLSEQGVLEIDPLKVSSFIGLENIYYTNETKTFLENKRFEKNTFKFTYRKFSLTGMTIPLKYRSSIGDDLTNPPTLETGFNVNFAPSYRFNWSLFNPEDKFLGNKLTNYSITFGGLLGIGATDLKVKSNAPNLLSDRKSTIFTYGGMVLFGLNSIGVGYAFGFDNVLGTGRKNWVYQNRLWHGITVAVDLIK